MAPESYDNPAPIMIGLMMAVLAGRLFYFFVPGGVLLLAGVLFGSSVEILHWRPVVARLMLVGVPAFGLFICWRFNRFKPAFGVLVLLLAEWALHSYYRKAGADLQFALSVRDMVALLLPLNFAWLALSREKGLVSPAGLMKLLFICVQPLWAGLLYLYRPELLSGVGTAFLSWDLSGTIPLAQSAIAAYLVALTILTVNFFRYRRAIDAGFIWALIAAYLGLAVYSGLLSTISMMLAGLILVASVVETAHSMAFRDELTGLPSRRALDELLVRLRGGYTVAMLDIDFFKKFNDTYGHDVGDQVLKKVASHIGRVRGGGRSFRYGGEEFTVVFPGKSVDETASHLERLRKSVEEAGFSLRGASRPKSRVKGRKGRGASGKSDGKRIGVTISIGASSKNQGDSTPAQVVKKADQALYKAKKAGRNRVVY